MLAVKGRPPASRIHRHVTLNLTDDSEDVTVPCIPKMNFSGQGFQKLEHYKQTDRKTDAT